MLLTRETREPDAEQLQSLPISDLRRGSKPEPFVCTCDLIGTDNVVCNRKARD